MLDFEWLRKVKNSVDIVQQRWNDWVIEYGAKQQADLFAPLGLGAMTPKTLVLVLVVAVILISLVVFPIVLRIKGPGEKDPARRLWLKFLRRLESAGFAASLSDGPLELGLAASDRLPQHRQSIGTVSDLYTRCRYSPNPPPLDELKRAVRDFKPKKKGG